MAIKVQWLSPSFKTSREDFSHRRFHFAGRSRRLIVVIPPLGTWIKHAWRCSSSWGKSSCSRFRPG